jgi:hypothetical protein
VGGLESGTVRASNRLTSAAGSPLDGLKLGSGNVNPGPLAAGRSNQRACLKKLPVAFSPFQPSSLLLTSCRSTSSSSSLHYLTVSQPSIAASIVYFRWTCKNTRSLFHRVVTALPRFTSNRETATSTFKRASPSLEAHYSTILPSGLQPAV